MDDRGGVGGGWEDRKERGSLTFTSNIYSLLYHFISSSDHLKLGQTMQTMNGGLNKSTNLRNSNRR